MDKKYKLNLCVKGSSESGNKFIKETDNLSKIASNITIDLNYPHDHNFKKELDYLRDLKAKKNINYVIHAQYLNGNIGDLNYKIRNESFREIIKAILTAKRLNAKIVIIHPAIEPYGLRYKSRENIEIDSYKKIATYAKRNNIFVALENEAQTSFWFPNRACKFSMIKKILSKINSKNFGLALDIGHANISEENYLRAILDFNKQIFHIHAHDNFGKAENNLKKFNRPDPHKALGDGKIKWRPVIANLDKISYEGFFEIECDIKNIRKSVNFLNKKGLIC